MNDSSTETSWPSIEAVMVNNSSAFIPAEITRSSSAVRPFYQHPDARVIHTYHAAYGQCSTHIRYFFSLSLNIFSQTLLVMMLNVITAVKKYKLIFSNSSLG